MQIIGHRGASAIYPENTMLAFEQALEMGAHGLELDIQCTRDGVAVVFHDDTLERMTGATSNLKDMTLEQLSQLRIEEEETIPTLASFMDRFGGETTLWLEIKDPACVPELVHTIQCHVQMGKGSYAQYVVIGFDTEALAQARALDSELCIGYSLEALPDQHIIEQLKPAYVVPQFELASETFVHEMASQGIQVVVWTLNEINDSLRMQERGVVGIITDVPNILYNLFHG